jgi:uncharacterized membrane protein YfcA
LSQHLIVEVAIVALCLAAGGVLKGATGAGAPLLAVPALAAFFDVRFAVVVMLVPNLVTNLWQAVRFRASLPERGFMVPLLFGGVLGIVAGTAALKSFRSDLLSMVMALAVFAYVALRLARPGWRLEMQAARFLAMPAGLIAGALQGAAGLSAPVSITFLNAMQMGRDRFIAAISALFVTFTAIQLVAIVVSGLVAPAELWYSLLALLPLSLAMPLGAALGRRVSALALDRAVLAVLCMIAARLLIDFFA